MKIKIFQAFNFWITFIYFILLLIIIEKFLLVDWAYMGYNGDLILGRLAFSIVLIGFVDLMISQDEHNIHALYENLFYFSFLIPCIALFTYNMIETTAVFAAISSLIFYILLKLVWLRKINIIPIRHNLNNKHLNYLYLLLVVMTIASMSRKQLNFDLTEIYLVRDAQKEALSGMFVYIQNWISKVLLPLTFVFCTLHKKYLLGSMVILCILFNFGVINSKANALLPFVALIIAVFLRYPIKVRTIGLIASLALFGFIILDLIFNIKILVGLIARRGLFSGPMNLEYYIEFFSTNPKVIWSNSIFSILHEYPYSLKPGEIIGDWLNKPNNHNAGLVASGFMHAGYVGVYAYTFIIYLINSILVERNDVIQTKTVTTFMAVYATLLLHLIINVDLTNSLLTHGLLFFLFVNYLKKLAYIRNSKA